MGRPTISDVAKRAGVSKTTVSRLLNGMTDSMRKETRDRILIAIEDLEYRPNAIARSLANSQTNTIGLLISDVENPFYSEVIRGIEEIGLQHGYRVLLCNTDYDLQRGLSFIDSLVHGQVDGALLMSSRMNEALIEPFIEQEVPFILWDWPSDVPEAVAHLNADYQAGIAEAVEHLVKLGHEHIAYLCGTHGLATTDARIDSYLSALDQYHLLDRALIEEGNYKIEGGRYAMQRLLDAYPNVTAVLSANDMTAIGAMQAVKARGLRVPDDISIIGMDDVYLTTLVDPLLSTVALPRLEIGSTAMEMMLSYLEDDTKDRVNESRVFSTHLILRESIGPPHA
jgi:LacI family transcriptional regulator